VNVLSEIIGDEDAELCGVTKRGEHAVREHIKPIVNKKRNTT